MLDKYVSIIWAIIKNPYEYFLSEMPKDNSARESLIFAIIVSSVSSIIYFISTSFTQQFGIFIILTSIIILPIILIIFLYSGAFFTHLVIFMFCPQRSNFKQTLKVLAYSSATNVFFAVPVVGAFFVFIFQIRATVFGLSAVHNVSALKLFIIMLIIPIILSIVFVVLLFALFGSVLMPYYQEILSSF